MKLEAGEREKNVRRVPPERFSRKLIIVSGLIFGVISAGLLNYLALGFWRGVDRGWIAGIVLAAFSLLLFESGVAASKRFAQDAPADSGQAAGRGAWLGFSYGFPRWAGAMIVAWAGGKMAGFEIDVRNEYLPLIQGGVAGAIATFALGAVIFSRAMESARGDEDGAAT